MAYKTSLQALTAHPKRSSSQPQAGSCREEELRRMDVVDAYEISHDEFDEKLEKEWFLWEVREEVMRRFFRRVNAARAEEKEGIGSEEEEGDAEDPPVTIQRLLLKFCGKWSDGRSEYEVILDPGKLNSCTVCTRRPNGVMIETRGLIKCNRYTGWITWGKHYVLRTDWRPITSFAEKMVWKSTDGRKREFHWHRINANAVVTKCQKEKKEEASSITSSG